MDAHNSKEFVDILNETLALKPILPTWSMLQYKQKQMIKEA